MIAENVRKVFEDNLWFVSTCGDGPHVVPVGFKCVTEDDKFAIGALLLEVATETDGTSIPLCCELPLARRIAAKIEKNGRG